MGVSQADSTISARQRRILMALCREYVLGGRPVASAALCSADLEWSSATIRNELAAIERAGLVHKPHAASGRVPTSAGWRIYVEALPRSGPRPEHQRLLDVSLGDSSSDPRLGLRSTARVLSEISGCVAIGFFGEVRPGIVRALELVPLAGTTEGSRPGMPGMPGAPNGRALVLMGLEDGSSSVRTIEIDGELFTRAGAMRRLQDLLRELTLGHTLERARQHLRELLDAQEQRVDRLVAEALRIGLLLCVASFDPLWMQVAGRGSLLTRDATSEGDSIAEVLTLLEDYQRVAEILCQLLPDAHADPRVSVRVDLAIERLGAIEQHAAIAGVGGGHGGVGMPLVHAVSDREREPRASGLTLIGCRLRWPGPDSGPDAGSHAASHTTGAVALLGSPRMDYEAVIPLVEYAARAMAARG